VGTPVFALFSGGHDSLASTAIAAKRPDFTAAVHINTGIGIEETRQFVRDTCQRQGWPLIEMHPDAKTYEQLIRERGFPSGPKSHNAMYYWLKQRQVRRLVREHKQGLFGRVVLVTGIRLDESVRRMGAGIAVPVRRQGAQVWENPILYWTAFKVSQFIDSEGLKRNEVVDVLHRSGECLCGALAHRDEIRLIEMFYPAAAERIHDLEREAAELGLPARWAAKSKRTTAEIRGLELCHSCQLDYLDTRANDDLSVAQFATASKGN
jgi:3'-phosphoadenosine 5'-phosphosulfate sulfotransferase (PAPS reductase)/FAD synthetase